MSKPKTETSALTAASAALEDGLARWESLVTESERLEPSSDKTLGRAKKLLEDSAACERELAQSLHAFVSAMQAVQERQRVCMERTSAAAQRLQDRVASRQALLDRFAQLGVRAGEINDPVATVMEAIGRGAPAQELAGPLDDVVAKTEEVANEADGVAKSAREQKWDDIAREADALRQQILSVKKKLSEARGNVASRMPS